MSGKLDNRVIKKIYPRENNNSTLTFVIDADPNLCLEKNRLQIFFEVDVHEKYMPENGFASKLFSSLSVELNSQLISNNRTRNEYPLIDRIIKMGNFESSYNYKAFISEGKTSYDISIFNFVCRVF